LGLGLGLWSGLGLALGSGLERSSRGYRLEALGEHTLEERPGRGVVEA
jgi:hypothetical protein